MTSCSGGGGTGRMSSSEQLWGGLDRLGGLIQLKTHLPVLYTRETRLTASESFSTHFRHLGGEFSSTFLKKNTREGRWSRWGQRTRLCCGTYSSNGGCARPLVPWASEEGPSALQHSLPDALLSTFPPVLIGAYLGFPKVTVRNFVTDWPNLQRWIGREGFPHDIMINEFDDTWSVNCLIFLCSLSLSFPFLLVIIADRKNVSYIIRKK